MLLEREQCKEDQKATLHDCVRTQNVLARCGNVDVAISFIDLALEYTYVLPNSHAFCRD